jgi:signal transduction histidine kinase
MKDQSIPKKAVLLSFVASLIFPTLIYFILSPLIDRILVRESTDEAFSVAGHIASGLKFEEVMMVPDALADDLSLLKESFTLHRINLISAGGEIIFSTDGQLVGAAAGDVFFRHVLPTGLRHAEFKPRSSPAHDGEPVGADLIEAYLPVMRDGRLAGVVEVYHDVSDVYADFNRLKMAFALTLFGISFVSMLVLAGALVKAERRRLMQMRAEEELTREQIKAETVFSSLKDNIIIQDREYKIIYQNRINRDLYGDRLGEQCHKVYEGLDVVCPGCPVELGYQDGEVHKQEKEVQTAKGTLWFELTAAPLRNSSGEIVAGVKLVRDITEKRALEQQLRHSQKMEAIGSLASGISHEFNNILTSVIGCSEMLLDHMASDDPNRKYVDVIHSSGKRAEVLTRGLLTFSRKHISNKSEISLTETVRGIDAMLATILGKGVELGIEAPDEDVSVIGDRNQIEQVLINIITNSRDAMPEDGGRITVRVMRAEPSADVLKRLGLNPASADSEVCYACVSVRDTGHGMGTETMQHLFEPFYTTKEVGRGTGLGLSVVYGIVENHGGFIDVRSAPGEGTEFLVYLPC